MNLIAAILLLAISSYCINLTYSASAGDGGKEPWTPGRALKRFLSSGKKKEVQQPQDKERKKGHMGSSSQGISSRGKEVQYLPEHPDLTHEPRDMPRGQYTTEHLLTILRLMFITAKTDRRQREHTDWDAVHSSFETLFRNMSTRDRLRTRGNTILRNILQSFRKPDEHVDWNDTLNKFLLKIFFQTEDGTGSTHDERMRAAWQEKRHLPEVEPGYLYNRAENMLRSVKARENLDDLHSGASTHTSTRMNMEWHPEYDNFLLNCWLVYDKDKHGPKEKYLHENAVNFDRKFESLTKKQVYEHTKHLAKKWQGPYGGDDPAMERGLSSHHSGGMGSSRANPELSQGHLDLGLRLGSLDAHQHSDQGAHDSGSD